MDVESPEHFERILAAPAIKALCLVHRPEPDSATARFERGSKHNQYWPPIAAQVAQLLTAGSVKESFSAVTVDDRLYLLLTLSLKPGTAAPFAVALVSASESADPEVHELIRSVTRDYWFGSSFFK